MLSDLADAQLQSVMIKVSASFLKLQVENLLPKKFLAA